MTIFVVNVHHTQLFSFLQCQECFSRTVMPLKFTFKLTITRSSPPPPPPVAILHLVYNNKVQYFPLQKLNQTFLIFVCTEIPVLLIENYIYQHEKSGGWRLFFYPSHDKNVSSGGILSARRCLRTRIFFYMALCEILEL